MDEIKRICEKHGALLIEDAAEAMGATIDGKQCDSFGDYSAVSYNGNKIITGSSGASVVAVLNCGFHIFCPANSQNPLIVDMDIVIMP